MSRDRIVIIGAGMGGLAAALSLAARGEEVLVIERQQAPGGKMRRLETKWRKTLGLPAGLIERTKR